MKPIYLEFRGINSFSETAKIDFRALLKGGLFGIFGDTGSGKSTILDAIHFALYGEVDRVPKAFSDCINYRSDSAEVTFDFELMTEGARKTYRVKRERKRKTGTTKAYLYEHGENGALKALAEGTRDVDNAIGEIVGLTFEDFKTCIALPQGDFAALVKSTNAERVKLVSRLFDLEKYGERLSVAVNAKCREAEEEVRVTQAKMGENRADKEQLDALAARINELKTKLTEAQKALEKAEAEQSRAAEAEKEKRAYDALCKRLEAIEASLPEMQKRREKAEKLPQAKAVCEKYEALQKTTEERANAEKRAREAESRRETLEKQAEELKTRTENERYEEKTVEAQVRLERLVSAEAEIAAAQKAEKALSDCYVAYRAIKDKCPAEDFEGKKAALEAKLEALGADEDLLDYLKHNYKGVLLADAYGEMRKDLRSIAEKYPQTQADIQALVGKYRVEQTGESVTDIATVDLAFKRAEQERKAIRAETEALDKRYRAYKDNESEKALLTKQGKLLRQAYETASEKIAFLKDLGTEAEARARLDEIRKAQAAARARAERLADETAQSYAEAQKQKGLAETYAKMQETQTAQLDGALQEGGFETAAEAYALVRELGNAEAATAELKAFFEDYETTKRRKAETDTEKLNAYDETALARAEAKARDCREAANALHRELGATEKHLQTVAEAYEKYKKLEAELAEKEKRQRLCEELRALVRGNRFLEYIASEYLQEICGGASKTLLSLTGGRYFLRYEDKEFKVGDNLDGGNVRAVKTLSGGETFLVSLSLALSLSAAICMKSLRPIEFFFLDEGFGTLDEKLVETVMDVLGKLSKSFSVGLISHVEELKRRIENKIVVTAANELHGSQVQVETL